MSRQRSNDLIRSIFIRITFFIAGIITVSGAFAQNIDSTNYVQPFSKASSFRTWSIELSGGIVVPFNEDYFSANYKQPGVGITIKNQFLPTLGIQMDIMAGQALGYNSRDALLTQFKTQFASAAISLNLTLANINWRNKQSFIQPYITAGYGYMGYQPTISAGTGASQVTVLYKQPGNGILQQFFVPVSAGFKIILTRGINIDLGYTVGFVNADDFDGNVYGTRNDEFSYIHAGVEFAIGNHKKPQLGTHNPVNSMRTEYLTQERSLTLMIDAQRAQVDMLKSELAAKAALINSTNASLIKFTMDSDGDGVADLFDKCPDTPPSTVVDGAGCPLVFSGLPAEKNTPNKPGAQLLMSAPIPRQPQINVAVTDAEKRVITDAVENLQFDFDKAAVSLISYKTLQDLAKLMVARNLSLKLAGYTDNVGPDAVNLKLSQARADAVKRFLVSRGVNPSKIETQGYGKENPIAPNNTADGRLLNRRVEFTLY